MFYMAENSPASSNKSVISIVALFFSQQCELFCRRADSFVLVIPSRGVYYWPRKGERILLDGVTGGGSLLNKRKGSSTEMGAG